MTHLKDHARCLLTRGGWAYRARVGASSSIQSVPIAIVYCDRAGLESEGSMEFRANGKKSLTLQRTKARALLLGLDTTNIVVRPNDLLFIRLANGRAEVERRRWVDRPVDDPLARLLWHCGLDPRAASDPRQAWRELGITLGGEASNAEHVIERLERRGDDDAVAWAKEATRTWAVHLHEPWPSGWEHLLAAEPNAYPRLAIGARDGTYRVVIGTSGGVERLPRGSVLTGGGLVWKTTTDFDLPESAADASWSRWLYAEHRGRRAALLGIDWVLRWDDGAWRNRDGVANSPEIYLESLPMPDEVPSIALPPISRPYPSTREGWETLVRDAVDADIKQIGSDIQFGFAAVRSDGTRIAGVSLPDLLRSGSHTLTPSCPSLTTEIGPLPQYLSPGTTVIHRQHGVCRVVRVESRVVEAIRRDYIILEEGFKNITIWSPLPAALEDVLPLPDSAQLKLARTILSSKPAHLARSRQWKESNRTIEWGELEAMVADLRDLAAELLTEGLPLAERRHLRNLYCAVCRLMAAATNQEIERADKELSRSLKLDAAFPSGLKPGHRCQVIQGARLHSPMV